ncbi:universal stress protein [Actinomadura soli]|uniref:Universal stress protein n=1 Tax=Actinomadura soli TaxID=2508997 RepID=A0A5C4JI30_9ACTN|nr:universal stress protein [Actinomadura soli]TMR04221.1 universal stress protein [Actinomadura soli]
MSAPIVVGTDGSGAADRAVDWAAEEAALRRRPLHIVDAAEIWPYQVCRFVPPDEPESATRAGRAALLEAEKRVGARRPRVVHSWQVSAALADSECLVEEEWMNDERRARIIAACAPLHERYPLVEVVNEVLVGHPVSALSKASRTAGLVVVGAHRRPLGLARLGSVSHGVIHHAECAVAVIGRTG